jgi:CRP-like cAMP-binding protein
MAQPKRVRSINPPPPSGKRPLNRLLASLPAADFARIAPDLETIPAKLKQVFHRHGEVVRNVYFPNGGVVSVTAVLNAGAVVEVATVGDEGMVGLEAFFGTGALAQGDTMMQVPDTSIEMISVEAFSREIATRGALHDVMGRYAQVTVGQMMHSTACNALHQVHERCCRWLLMTHDRVHRDDFHLSHEFLGMMLGVRRQTVTVVAGTLQKAGLISYVHGHIRVLDRKGLEAAACECYASIREQFSRLQF